MFVSRINLSNYRNYSALTLRLSSGLNVFMGANAQGKTNMLEAVYLTSVGRSMRTPRDKELIRWGAEQARVRVETESAGGKNTVEIIVSARENKRVTINGASASRMGELMGVVTAVLFSPDEIAIVKQSPGERRRFMDIALCQLSRAYFYLLTRYNKALSQRNKLLKERTTGDVLEVFDLQLADIGCKIAKTRRGFISGLAELAKREHSFLTDEKEILNLEYEGIDGETEEEVRLNFFAELKRDRERDLIQGFTHSGVQTDDFAIKIGDVDVRKFGSQGQQRTAALSLKLAALKILHEETGEPPVLLLDDVFSELDERRRIKLVERLDGYQTIVTCTEIDSALNIAIKKAKIFSVSGGVIECVNQAE